METIQVSTSTLINADCMDYLSSMQNNQFDLAIVDPPYGIDVCKNKSGMGRRKGDAKASYKIGKWDNSPPTIEYFNQLFRVSKHQIVFGANHFISRIPFDSPCWIVWDKMFSTDVSFASVELAWTSFRMTCKRYVCHPLNPDRIHPTQKPVELYEWILNTFAKQGDSILDTHLGSGSSAIACHNLHFRLTGFEIDKDYFCNAVKRITKETSQTTFAY